MPILRSQANTEIKKKDSLVIAVLLLSPTLSLSLPYPPFYACNAASIYQGCQKLS